MRSSLFFFFALIVGTVAAVLPVYRLSPMARQGGQVVVRLAVWGMPFEDRLFLDRYARTHEQYNPHVRVDYQRHSDLTSKYRAWHANNDGAEVMRLGIDYYPQFVEHGMLEPLDDFINLPEPYGLSEAEMAAFPPTLIEHLRIDGKLYGLPQDSAQYGLYYNKTLFDAYNREHPEDPIEYPNASWTWAEVRDAARKLTQRDERQRLVVSGLDMPLWSWPFFNFFSQAGGQLWSDDGLTTGINSEAGVDALVMMRTLIVEDRVWEPHLGDDQGSGPAARFAAGQTAMMYGGSWWVPFFETNNPDLDFAVSPVPRGRVAAVPCGMVVWSISANARHKHEGWRMIRWLVAQEQAQAYWDKLRVAPPANLRVLQSDGFRETRGLLRRDIGGNVIQGEYEVPPMPRDRYEDRAAWLNHAWTPDETGRTPDWVIAGRYQQQLQNELQSALEMFVANPADHDPQAVLDRVARRVHEQIDRERAAAGMPPVQR